MAGDVASEHVAVHPGCSRAVIQEAYLKGIFGVVDVRDVAQMLRRHLGAAADKAPRRQIPDWLLRIASLWDAGARQTLPNVGKLRRSRNATARRILGWAPRSSEDAVVATALSLTRQAPHPRQA